MTASAPALPSASVEAKVSKQVYPVDETVKPSLVEAEYAVRGAITVRAAQIESELKAGTHSYNFNKVLYCNIGNPQALDQKPISFFRRLIACCECPEVCISAESCRDKPRPCHGRVAPQSFDHSLRYNVFSSIVMLLTVVRPRLP